MATITADGLTKRYGPLVAVDDLSFSLTPGAITGFIGRNGAGKTTTLKMILGLTRPTSGSATIDGVAYADLDGPPFHVGALLEATGFHPGRSGRDHLRVVAATAGIPDHRVDAILAEVDLTAAARRRVGGYSLGMRQRLGLAAALLGDPEFLVLDEPANGLDPEGVHWLRGLLRRLAAEGRTVFVSSHGLAELADVADEALIIDRGRFVAHGPLSDLGVRDGRDLEDLFLDLTAGGGLR